MTEHYQRMILRNETKSLWEKISDVFPNDVLIDKAERFVLISSNFMPTLIKQYEELTCQVIDTTS